MQKIMGKKIFAIYAENFCLSKPVCMYSYPLGLRSNVWPEPMSVSLLCTLCYCMDVQACLSLRCSEAKVPKLYVLANIYGDLVCCCF